MEVRASRKVWTETGWEIVPGTPDLRETAARQVSRAEETFCVSHPLLARDSVPHLPAVFVLPRGNRKKFIESPFRRRIRMGIDDRGDLKFPDTTTHTGPGGTG